MTKDEAIGQVLTTALEAAKKTGAWLQGQVPDVVHQLIAWHVTADILNLVLLAAGVTTGGFAVRYAVKSWSKWEDTDCEPLAILFGGGGTALGIVCLCSFVSTAFDLTKLIVAPKVWLLEYAAHLVK